MAITRRAVECIARRVMASTGQHVTMLLRSRHSGIYCRLKMLCLLIAHGIFLRQEASQSRACHHEESPTCKDPLGARSISPSQVLPPRARALACV